MGHGVTSCYSARDAAPLRFAFLLRLCTCRGIRALAFVAVRLTLGLAWRARDVPDIQQRQSAAIGRLSNSLGPPAAALIADPVAIGRRQGAPLLSRGAASRRPRPAICLRARPAIAPPRTATDMAGVPTTGGDATGYDVTSRNGPGKPGVFDQKCRASPRAGVVYESRVSVTVSE